MPIVILSVSMRKQYSDEEITGMLDHELGHLHNQFYFGESLDVENRDISLHQDEHDADETASDLGFGMEINLMPTRIGFLDP